jgi:hypothetical protein
LYQHLKDHLYKSNQNYYNPTNLATASILRLTSDANRTITGIAGGSAGRLLILQNRNTSNFTITLSDESASSSAANRMAFGGTEGTARDYSLPRYGGILLWYDGSSSRWRPVGNVSDISGPNSTVTTNAVTKWNGTTGKVITESGVIIDSSNNVTVPGNVTLSTAGNGLLVKQGTNATAGRATLASGTVTVNTTKVTANSQIFVTPGTGGALRYVSARTASTSFTITSSSGADAGTCDWLIVEPAP